MPTNYDYYVKEIRLNGASGAASYVRVIETDLDNIKTETILKPISKTNFTGINGGFFSANNGYNKPPTGSSSICYYDEDDEKNVTVEGVTHPAIGKYNKSSSGITEKKTMVIYYDREDNYKTKVTYLYIKDVDEVLSHKQRYVTNIIGGNDYNRSSWSTKSYYAPIPRTVIAWKNDKVYLITTDFANIPGLKVLLKEMKLDPVNSVILDGSFSTCTQVEVNGRLKHYGGDRYIYNMIKLKKAY